MSLEHINKAIAMAHELLAAGKKAAAEGEVIIAQRPKDWSGRAGHAHARFRVPKPAPKLDAPKYVLTSTDDTNVKAVATLMKISKISKRGGLRAAAYRDIGSRIAELRQKRDEAEWGDILRRECGLSLPRAYDLMAMASAANPVDQLRSERSGRVEKHTEKKAA